MLLGVIDRFASEDVRLIVVEPSSTKRRAVDHLGRDVVVVAPDQADDVAEVLDDHRHPDRTARAGHRRCARAPPAGAC